MAKVFEVMAQAVVGLSPFCLVLGYAVVGIFK